MKTVTSGFSAVQKREGSIPIYRVYYKRRYWDTVTTAYIYESSWTEISQSEIVAVDPISHQFDSQSPNEFKVSNTVLRFKNDKMQWKEGSHTDSRFKPDGTSSFGYEPYLTKFQIRTGYKNVGQSDIRQGESPRSLGNEELVTVFTGLATEFWTDSLSRISFISCTGLEEILLNGDATRVVTTVTLETVGTGDGVTVNYYTAYTGVSKVTAVTVNAVTMNPGTDYEVLNVGSFDNPVQIVLAEPAASGHLVKCTYERWKTNQTVDQLISDLVTEAGISLTSIDNATLGAISNNITLSSQGEFSEGTNTDIDLSSEPGAIQVAMGDLSDASNMTLWNSFASGTPDDGTNLWVGIGASIIRSWSIVSGELKGVGDNSGSLVYDEIRRAYTGNIAFGAWQWDARLESGGGQFQFWFIANSDTDLDHHGYYLAISEGGSFHIKLVRKVEGETAVTLWTGADVDWTSTKTIRIHRSMNGVFKIYIDSVLWGTVQDNEIDSGDRFVMYNASASTSNEGFFDKLYIPSSTLTATHVSKSIDTISGLSAWGNLSVDYEATIGSITVETRTSTDNSTWDSWTAIGATNAIASAVKRYIQVRLSFSVSSGLQASAFGAPSFFGDVREDSTGLILKVNSYTVQFTSTRVFVAMGNFNGQSCYQAIQGLSKLVDFEWGVDDNETFFFRARDVSATPDDTFNSNSNLLDILSLVNGHDRTFSIFRAQFGNFTAEQSTAADTRTSPLEIYGKKFFTISSSILLNQDTDIADALCSIYKTRLQYKKRRVRIRTKFWPQMELSDTVSITFNHETYPPPNPLDPSTVLPSREPMLNALIAKIIYSLIDVENRVCEFECEEIL